MDGGILRWLHPRIGWQLQGVGLQTGYARLVSLEDARVDNSIRSYYAARRHASFECAVNPSGPDTPVNAGRLLRTYPLQSLPWFVFPQASAGPSRFTTSRLRPPLGTSERRGEPAVDRRQGKPRR